MGCKVEHGAKGGLLLLRLIGVRAKLHSRVIVVNLS